MVSVMSSDSSTTGLGGSFLPEFRQAEIGGAFDRVLRDNNAPPRRQRVIKVRAVCTSMAAAVE